MRVSPERSPINQEPQFPAPPLQPQTPRQISSKPLPADPTAPIPSCSLPQEDYTVIAQKTGFNNFTATKIHLDVNQVYTQPAQLTLGATTEAVTVQANPTQVESTTPQLGVVIDSNQIVNMPLIGRNFVNLQALEPGVVGASDRFGVNFDFATNGSQSQANVYLIDGTETNDIALNTPGFIPSPDASISTNFVWSRAP